MARIVGDTSDDNNTVISQLSDSLKTLITSDVRGDVEREKMYQYALARKHELYWRGDQFLIPMVSEGGLIVDWSPITGNVRYNDADAQTSLYDYVVNDFRGYGRKFCAVLQNPPNCKAQPNRKGNQEDERRARKAQEVSDQITSLWKLGEINRSLAMSLFKNGTTFLYTPFVANPDRWGYSYEPIMEMRDVQISPPTLNCPQCGNIVPMGEDMPPTACPRCGRPFGPADIRDGQTAQIPEIVGRQKYANGAVECHVCNIFTVTAPFYAKTLRDAQYLYYEYEEDKGALLAAYPKLRDIEGMGDNFTYYSGSAASAYGKLARDTASSLSGAFIAPRKNRWLYTRMWLRPSRYELIDDSHTVVGADEQRVKARDLMYEMYPQGCRITMVQDKIVKISPERLERVWAMAKSDLSEYMFSDPYGKDFVGAQDLINDMHNIAAQTWERAVPAMGVIASRIDFAAWTRMRPTAAELVPFTDGTDLGTVMKPLPVSKPEAAMGPWIDGFREHNAEIIGVTRPIFGGSLPTETAHQAELNKQQALQQLELVWKEISDAHAQARQNAILQMAEHSGGRIPDPYGMGEDVTEIEEIEELKDGGWHIEAAPDMPMTWSERRAWLMQVLGTKNPQVLAMLGFSSPDNIESLQEVMAIPDWKVPNLDAKAKVLATIQQLLQGAPTQQPQPDGSMLPAPSIPADVFEDNHEFSALAVKDWAQTEEARMQKERNPDGYANVIAWARAHLRLMTPPAPPPGPAGRGGPPAGGGAPAGPQPPGAPSGAAPLPPMGAPTAPATPQAGG